MFQIAKPIFLHCQTPLHAGASGGIGTELPIQREEHTGFPKVEASGLKGAFREVFEAQKPLKGLDPELIAVFGHPTEGDSGAGALGLTDARLLLFPVRSRRAVFAWVTCPRVLKRFARDLEISKTEVLSKLVAAALADFEEEKALVCDNNCQIKSGSKIFLEEFAFETKLSKAATELATALSVLIFSAHEKQEIVSQFAIVSDDFFADFVQNCTEHHTRIKIGENGVVETGALFTEEHLPAESILYSLVLAQPELRKGGLPQGRILEVFSSCLPEIVQIGGNATLGKGIVKISKTFLTDGK